MSDDESGPLTPSAAVALVVSLTPASLGAQAHVHGRAAPARPDTTLASEAGRAESTIRALFGAIERKDVAALDTLYAGDSLTVVEGTGINPGWTDYRDRHLAPELREMQNFRYRPFEIEPRVAGNVAWATFRYALQADVNGRPIDAIGRGIVILERSGERWVVRHTQTSSRARRPNDPPMPQ